MKEPGFGVKASRTGVVRHPHFCPGLLEFIERSAFSRSRIRRREHAERTTTLAMPSKRVAERRDSAPPDECDYDVDTVSRTNLGKQLIAHARLAGGIREKRGVQKRDQRLVDRFRTPIREPRRDCSEHLAGLDRCVRPQIELRVGPVDFSDDPTRQRRAEGDALFVVQCGDGTLHDAPDVQCDSVGSLRRT